MSYSKDYTKTYKFRTSPAQADALESYAESNNYSISEAIRKLLFSDSDSLSVLIHKELVKQQVFNLLQNTKMPRKTREKLIEEVNKIDCCKYQICKWDIPKHRRNT